MKNELIIARFGGRPNLAAARRLQALLEEFGLARLGSVRFRLPADSAVVAGEVASA